MADRMADRIIVNESTWQSNDVAFEAASKKASKLSRGYINVPLDQNQMDAITGNPNPKEEFSNKKLKEQIAEKAKIAALIK